jgi:hypothetical protein
MGYLASYNTSSFSGSLDRGNINIAISSSIVSGSTGIIRFGDSPTPPSGGMVIVSDSNVQLGIASASATPQFWIINDLADTSSVLNTINALPERINQTRFTTTSSAYLYLVSSSKYFPILGTEPLNTIVTSGLTMYLDAGQLVSYPTTASLWYDISGNNNSGSLINSPTFNSNGAIILDGIDDYINQNYYTATNFVNNQSWTIDTLVNVISSQSAGNTRGGILTNQRYQTEPDPGGFGLNIIAQTYCINLTSGSTGNAISYQQISSIPINYNKIERITAIWDSGSSTAKLYRNGALVNAGTSISYGWSPVSTRSGLSQVIGTSTQGGWGYVFPMKLYNVSLYNKALSQAEINQNYYQAPIVTNGLVFSTDAGNLVSYESGSTTAYSLTGSISGSLLNGTGYSNGNGGSWVFDGIDDYISIPSNSTLDTTDNFTITIIFKSTNWTTNNQEGLFEKGNVSNYAAYLRGTLGSISFYTSPTAFWDPGPNVGGTNLWNIVTFVYSYSQLGLKQIYVNGSFSSQIAITNPINSNTSNLTLGYASSIAGPRYFKGNIASFYMYNRVLTSSEIQQNFNAQRNRFNI